MPWQRSYLVLQCVLVSLGANGVPVCYTTEISMCAAGRVWLNRRLKLKMAAREYESHGI